MIRRRSGSGRRSFLKSEKSEKIAMIDDCGVGAGGNNSFWAVNLPPGYPPEEVPGRPPSPSGPPTPQPPMPEPIPPTPAPPVKPPAEIPDPGPVIDPTPTPTPIPPPPIRAQ